MTARGPVLLIDAYNIFAKNYIVNPSLSKNQLEYAANDVLYLIKIYRKLLEMMNNRSPLKSSITMSELNQKAQAILPGLVELLINGYGDKDGGWGTSLFSH